jgi:hypothetical protein
VARTREALALAMWKSNTHAKHDGERERLLGDQAVCQVSADDRPAVSAPAHVISAYPKDRFMNTGTPLGASTAPGGIGPESSGTHGTHAADVAESLPEVGSRETPLLPAKASEAPGSGDRQRSAPGGTAGEVPRGKSGNSKRRQFADGWVWRAKEDCSGGRGQWDSTCLMRVDIHVPGRGVPVEGTEIYTTCGAALTNSSSAPGLGRVDVIGLRTSNGRGFNPPTRQGDAKFLPGDLFASTTSKGTCAPEPSAPKLGAAQSGPTTFTDVAPHVLDGVSSYERAVGENATPAEPLRPPGFCQRPWKLGRRKRDPTQLGGTKRHTGWEDTKCDSAGQAEGVRPEAGGVLIGFVTSGVPRGSWGLRGNVGFVSARRFFQAASASFQPGWKFDKGSPLPVALRNPGERLVYLALATPYFSDVAPGDGYRLLP